MVSYYIYGRHTWLEKIIHTANTEGQVGSLKTEICHNANFVIMSTTGGMVTTLGATNEEKVGIMTTVSCQYSFSGW